MIPPYTKFKSITHIGQVCFSEQVETNLAAFIQWALLEVGAFFNIQIPTSGAYGSDFSILRPTVDPNYTNGQVWEGARSDWVWETNLTYPYQPIPVTGIFVNNIYYPTNTLGSYSYTVNYPLGRIVFNNPISMASQVKLNYSYRYYHTSIADQYPWYREIMFHSFRVDDSHYQIPGTGQWSIPSNMRAQLPAIVIETAPRRTHIPHQLGGGTRTEQDVLFHVIAETPTDCKAALDAIDGENEHTIYGFDKNKMLTNNAFPLNEYGSPVSGALMYPDLVNPNGNYSWFKITFAKTRLEDLYTQLPLFTGSVRATIDVDTPLI